MENTEEILLFSVEMNPMDLFKENANMSVSIKSYDYLTNQETKRMQEILLEASKIVTKGLIRELKSGNSNEDEE